MFHICSYSGAPPGAGSMGVAGPADQAEKFFGYDTREALALDKIGSSRRQRREPHVLGAWTPPEPQ